MTFKPRLILKTKSKTQSTSTLVVEIPAKVAVEEKGAELSNEDFQIS